MRRAFKLFRSKLRFWTSVLEEIVLFPLNRMVSVGTVKEREDGDLSNTVVYHIHEWAGYPYERKKTIRYRNYDFSCGLKPAILRASRYSGVRSLKKILTVSGADDAYLARLQRADFFDESFTVVSVNNDGMDFSGYSYVVGDLLNSSDNKIVLLTNTSIDDDIHDFLDTYVDCFLANKNLGLLGVSYSSKIYQSLIKNNFNPHIQSFFMLTTSSMIREIVDANRGKFPGDGENYKLAIIKFGEARLSRLVQRLGYDIGVIDELGKLLVLPKLASDKHRIVDGDYRLFCRAPNRINKLT